MRLSRPLVWRAIGGVVLAVVMVAGCGGGGAADVATTRPAAESDGTESDRTGSAPELLAGDTSANAAGLADVFASATPLDGSSFDAASLDGTDAVVWFWAPWCTICRGEAPDVAEVAERYGSAVQFVGVPGRGELDAMQEFVDDTGTTSLTQLADLDGSIWSAFGVYGQPAYAFIDDSGTVDVFVGSMGGDALAERIDDLLAT